MRQEGLQQALRIEPSALKEALPEKAQPERAQPASTDLPNKQILLLRIWKHPLLMPYNRLIAVVLLANLAALCVFTDYFSSSPLAIETKYLANLILANFALAILIRQEYVINLLFWLATRAPTNWPLKLRWALGEVYHFGGLHVGAFFSGSLWLTLLSLSLTQKALTDNSAFSGAFIALLWTHVLVLCAMMIMALPKIRDRYHNAFEITARFGGWASLVFFWIQAFVMFDSQASVGGIHAIGTPHVIWMTPQFWVLVAITVSIALPWLRLRKVPVQLSRPSSHVVIAKFDYGVTPFAGSSTDVSRSPLLEWHSFANVPYPSESGYRLTISRAGDWTGRLIDDLPSHLWVRGIPTAGVGNIETLFKKVAWVATGSGIGPCLPHLLAQKVQAKLIWSTRDPRKTYGNLLVDEILRVQPDALIWNTDERGKPDMVKLAYEAYREIGAEAVICISNKKLTFHVVHELESRGIPAFGAIWDS